MEAQLRADGRIKPRLESQHSFPSSLQVCSEENICEGVAGTAWHYSKIRDDEPGSEAPTYATSP